MNKTLIVILSCLIILSVVSVVVANSEKWSFNKPFEYDEQTQGPIKSDCPREEWNWMFEEFREGNIPKDEMKEYVASCNY